MDELYIVQPGDTLSKIARDRLGDMNLWVDLAQWNNITDPDRINVGQTLRLAPPDQVRRTTMPVYDADGHPVGAEVRAIEPGLTIQIDRPRAPWLTWLFWGALVAGVGYFLMPPKPTGRMALRKKRGKKTARRKKRISVRRR